MKINMLAVLLSAVFSSAVVSAQDPQALQNPQIMARESLKVLFDNIDSPRQAWQELHLYQKRWCASFKQSNFECEKILFQNETTGLRLDELDLKMATEWLSFKFLTIEKSDSEDKNGSDLFAKLFTDKPWLETLTHEDRAQMKALHKILKNEEMKKAFREKDLQKIRTTLAAFR